MNWAFISGASSGIGEATARSLFAKGYSLILLARRESRLQELRTSLLKTSTSQEVILMNVDISDAASLQKVLQENKKYLPKIDVLINAAGLAKGVDRVDTAKLTDWDEMIDVNVKGLMHLTHAFLPWMKAKGSGMIVNIGSVAGRWVYPGGAVYCASKFAVRAFSEGLRQDLLGSGIRVCNIEPGMVQTEFSVVRLGDQSKADQVYENMTPLTGEDIARTIVWVVEQPRHVNIQELVIYPTDQAHVGQVYRKPVAKAST